MKVKPARPGLIIRDPHTRRALPDEGGDVPETSFWLRRLRDGDVIPIARAAAAPPTGLEPVAPLTTRAPTKPHKSEDKGRP